MTLAMGAETPEMGSNYPHFQQEGPTDTPHPHFE
jgi:hypothetical protein